MGRKKIEIDPEQLGKLAEMSCTHREVAAWFDIPPSTLTSRIKRNPLKAVWEKGQARGNIALRRAMYQAAVSGNVTAQIWLSKNLLGMADKVETKNEERTSFVVELPPPMSPKDWSDAFAPRGATIDHQPAVEPPRRAKA